METAPNMEEAHPATKRRRKLTKVVSTHDDKYAIELGNSEKLASTSTEHLMENLFTMSNHYNLDNIKGESQRDADDSITIDEEPLPECSVCAVCREEVDVGRWWYHKLRFHNNLAWRVGEPELDLNDKTLVTSILNAVCKKQKVLHCDKCDITRKSVVGLLSHLTVCRKDSEEIEAVKVTCDRCLAKVLPVSMSMHMRHCTGFDKRRHKHINIYQPVTSKRESALRARGVISNLTHTLNEEYVSQDINLYSLAMRNILGQQLNESGGIHCKYRNCKYVAKKMIQFDEHFETCEHKPKAMQFMCRLCCAIEEYKSNMAEHLYQAHGVEVNQSNDSQEIRSKRSKIASNDVDADVNSDNADEYMSDEEYLKTECSLPTSCNSYLPFQFRLKFYCDVQTTVLAETWACLRSHWTILHVNEFREYVPPISESCEFNRKCGKINKNLSQTHTLKLFDSIRHDESYVTVFCGGPISALAWQPTSYQNMRQPQCICLAVRHQPNLNYKVDRQYKENVLVQFWCYGLLDSDDHTELPIFLAGVAMDIGPIWYLEWCPSQSYEILSNDAVGFLAVAGSVEYVNIYSVPKIEKKGLIYNVKPIIRLMPSKARPSDSSQFYTTRVSWGKGKGNNCIAVGYSNGLVALYNLLLNKCPIVFMEDGVRCVLPYKTIASHSMALTGISLYFEGDVGVLITASYDRLVQFWSIDRHDNVLCRNFSTFYAPTDGLWSMNLSCCFVGTDESTSQVIMGSFAKFYNQCPGDSHGMLFSRSSITSVSNSDLLDALAHTNRAGEICAVISKEFEMTRSWSTKRILKQRVFLGNTTLKKRNSGGELGLATSYKTSVNKYSLLFDDSSMNSYGELYGGHEMRKNSKSYQLCQPNEFPLNAVNRIAFNPNLQACLYYATGYEAGFLRLVYAKCFKHIEKKLRRTFCENT